ncbi:hypothetical protein GQ54DRAFT_267024 [Martensiomyces pterosporus]|nr:hypothetical protein GQ54DRAFT_267024 [Martensiomyces pterosporus]
MPELFLRCNNTKCRQSLAHAESACITKCSHMFCMKCATNTFKSSSFCPACQTAMRSPQVSYYHTLIFGLPSTSLHIYSTDVMAVSLAVTEEYKSAILAGLPPLTIMDICSRALSFWSYQTTQEMAYQNALAQSQIDKLKTAEMRASRSVNEIGRELKCKCRPSVLLELHIAYTSIFRLAVLP